MPKQKFHQLPAKKQKKTKKQTNLQLFGETEIDEFDVAVGVEE